MSLVPIWLELISPVLVIPHTCGVVAAARAEASFHNQLRWSQFSWLLRYRNITATGLTHKWHKACAGGGGRSGWSLCWPAVNLDNLAFRGKLVSLKHDFLSTCCPVTKLTHNTWMLIFFVFVVLISVGVCFHRSLGPLPIYGAGLVHCNAGLSQSEMHSYLT